MMEKILRLFPYVRDLTSDIERLCDELNAARHEIDVLRVSLSSTSHSVDSPEGTEVLASCPENRSQAANIFFYMKMYGVTQRDISAMAGVDKSMVQRVIYGMRTSARVQKAIALALGFPSWTALTSVKRGVVA